METLKDTVNRIMGEWEAKRKSSSRDNPELLLRKALSKKELGHIKFNYLSKGILNIKVDSSAWLYQLSLHKEKLLAKLAKKSKLIKDVRFRLGETK